MCVKRNYSILCAKRCNQVKNHPPIKTVGHPIAIVPPCAQLSPTLAAGKNPIMTVAEPFAMVSGGPTQVAMSVALAAGINPIITVGQPGGRIGPPTCGFGPTGVGSCIGHVCMSPTLAAGGIVISNYSLFVFTTLSTIPSFQSHYNRDFIAGACQDGQSLPVDWLFESDRFLP